MDQRSLVGYSPWGRRESDTTERLHLLTHSLVVAEMELEYNIHWSVKTSKIRASKKKSKTSVILYLKQQTTVYSIKIQNSEKIHNTTYLNINSNSLSVEYWCLLMLTFSKFSIVIMHFLIILYILKLRKTATKANCRNHFSSLHLMLLNFYTFASCLF